MNIRMFCLELDECCASHDRCGQATADRCVQARPTTADRLCCPRAMMACHARRRPTVYAVKGRRWHATPDVVRPCVLQKGEDGMPRPTPFDRVCCPKAMMACMPRPTSFDRVCCPKAMRLPLAFCFLCDAFGACYVANVLKIISELIPYHDMLDFLPTLYSST